VQSSSLLGSCGGLDAASIIAKNGLMCAFFISPTVRYARQTSPTLGGINHRVMRRVCWTVDGVPTLGMAKKQYYCTDIQACVDDELG
jgi:hypothetical protein